MVVFVLLLQFLGSDRMELYVCLVRIQYSWNLWHRGAWMSKITNDGLTQSGIVCVRVDAAELPGVCQLVLCCVLVADCSLSDIIAAVYVADSSHSGCSSCLWHFIWKASRALESVDCI